MTLWALKALVSEVAAAVEHAVASATAVVLALAAVAVAVAEAAVVAGVAAEVVEVVEDVEAAGVVVAVDPSPLMRIWTRSWSLTSRRCATLPRFFSCLLRPLSLVLDFLFRCSIAQGPSTIAEKKGRLAEEAREADLDAELEQYEKARAGKDEGMHALGLHTPHMLKSLAPLAENNEENNEEGEGENNEAEEETAEA